MSEKRIKRVRMFAGPNGSGKSTVFRNIYRLFQVGHFLNADDMENQLQSQGFITLYDYGIQVTRTELEQYIKNSSLSQKAFENGLEISLRVESNIVLTDSEKVHSYEAALLSAFLREKLIEANQSFSFETVMSHSSKLDILKYAKRNNYPTYLYFICTDSPSINVKRVLN
ncbi:MAG: AAA family ATPase [Bacteroidetes bacterium]|nr:AAA family ATPase [Bacteroidota bacterium]